MSWKQALRKAAELVVEMPPEEAQESGEAISASLAGTGTAGGSATDKMWEELEQEAKKTSPIPVAPPTKTVEQIVRDAPGPNLDQIKVSSEALPQAANPDGTVNFSAIYQSANLPVVPFTAEQVLEMIQALPGDLPLDTKRQTLRVSINAIGKAIGATPENIVADASRKLAALAAYSEHLSALAIEYTTMAERKIAELQAQIEETRKAIAEAKAKQTLETHACATESDRLDDVLEFFSLDVPPSKYAATPADPNAKTP